jgi:sodium-independent sulfate anion transporter 11
MKYVVAYIYKIMGFIYANIGFIVNFISTPVNSGFTSAAAITICSTQIKALLGLKFAAEGFLPTVKGVIDHITDVKPADALLSLVSIIFLLILMVRFPIIVLKIEQALLL